MKTIHTDQTELRCRELTKEVIGAFYEVYNELRWGFLEKVYANALAFELESRGLQYVQNQLLDVYYKRRVVGVYKPDFIVGGEVVVEVKAMKEIGDADRRQLLNYLRATNMEVGLLMNFGPEAKFKRLILSR